MNQNPGTVYILDDEIFVRKLLEIIARSAGMTFRSFGNAVDFLDVWSPDMTGCIVTDLYMPTISGLELLKRMKEQNCTMPVILLTAAEDPKLVEEALQHGAYACLAKPIDKASLVSMLKEVMAPNPG